MGISALDVTGLVQNRNMKMIFSALGVKVLMSKKMRENHIIVTDAITIGILKIKLDYILIN